jgi:hypothetical protein
MTKISSLILLAVPLLAIATTGSCAPSDYPAANDSANGSVKTASSETTQTDPRASQPGWTGRTFAVGSHSTIADTAGATLKQQTAPYGRAR